MKLVAKEDVEGRITKGVCYAGSPIANWAESGEPAVFFMIYDDAKDWTLFRVGLFMPESEIGPP